MSINAVIPPFQYKERPVGGEGGGTLGCIHRGEKELPPITPISQIRNNKIGHYFPENFLF